MNTTSRSIAAEAESLIARLTEVFYARWNFGSNALVGWTYHPDGLQYLFAPSLQVLRSAAAHPRLIHGNRRMGPRTFAEVAQALGVAPEAFVSEEGLAIDADSAAATEVDKLVSHYAIIKTRKRAVFLLDIAGFSLFSPEEQAAQLTTLDYSLNIAREAGAAFGIELDLAQSTTGDGFYVWNRNKGQEADANLFCVLMIALAHQALQLRTISPPYIPTIRTSFGFGSHYSYHQHSRLDPVGHDYIVGDVTIHLARLIQHARPNQILVSAARGENGADEAETDSFMARVAQVLGGLPELHLADAAVTRIAAYLTGARKPDGEYEMRRLKFQDKHGISHAAYNAKVNIFLKGDEPIYLGLQEEGMPSTAA